MVRPLKTSRKSCEPSSGRAAPADTAPGPDEPADSQVLQQALNGKRETGPERKWLTTATIPTSNANACWSRSVHRTRICSRNGGGRNPTVRNRLTGPKARPRILSGLKTPLETGETLVPA
jgi:hypothetical protein